MNSEDIKKLKVASTTITRKMSDFTKNTDNVYESLAIVSKRANQISVQLKEELNAKLLEFSSSTDTLEEIFENREQIELAKYYERLPKSTLIAIEEFVKDKIYYRNPTMENIVKEKNI